MKKVLSTVAAIGLVAGFAATASAGYMDFSVTGYYQIDGRMVNDGSTTGGGVQFTDPATAGVETYTRAWLEHDFRIFPVLKVNDNVTMKGEVRALSDTLFDDATTGNPVTQGGAAPNLTANKVYMEYVSPIGMFTMGLTPAGAWGSPFMNTAASANRIIYTPNMISDPFSLTVFMEKNVEAEGTATAMNNTTSDEDNTSYYVGTSYKLESAKFMLAYFGTVDGTPTVVNGGAVSGSTRQDQVWFQAEGTIGPVNYLTEVIRAFGDASTSTDLDAWASMILLSGKVTDQLSIGGVYFMATGNDNNSTDNEQMLGNAGTGYDWEPTYIMFGDDMGVFNGDTCNAGAALQAAGVEAFGIFADFALSPKTTFHTVLATGKANEVNNGVTTAAFDDDYGWEFDLGVAYKLLDNLTYELHFGYWEVGDFVQGGNAAVNPAEITLLTNHLTMKF